MLKKEGQTMKDRCGRAYVKRNTRDDAARSEAFLFVDPSFFILHASAFILHSYERTAPNHGG
jgi:hypothetical protein